MVLLLLSAAVVLWALLLRLGGRFVGIVTTLRFNPRGLADHGEQVYQPGHRFFGRVIRDLARAGPW
jgi:hypothetical protein